MKTLNELAKELHHVVTTLAYLHSTDPAQQRLADAIKSFASQCAAAGQQPLLNELHNLSQSHRETPYGREASDLTSMHRWVNAILQKYGQKE